MFYYSKKDNNLSCQAGFTLLEMMMVIIIVTIVLTVVVLRQTANRDGVALSNLAQDISLTLVQAQVYGVGVRELTPGSEEFSASYGLTFSLLGSGSPTAYLYFADRDDDGIYDDDWSCPTGGLSECLEKFDISNGNFIKDVCVVRDSGSDICLDVERADITFVRPKTEAQINFFNGGGAPYDPLGKIGVRITLESPEGATKDVVIYKTGQVSVQ